MDGEKYLFSENSTPQYEKEIADLTEGAVKIMECFRLNIGEKTPPKDIDEFKNREELINRNEAKNIPGKEKLLVVVEKGLEPEVKEALQIAAQQTGGNNVEYFVINDSTAPAEPLPDTINEKLKNADAILIASKYSRTYSEGMRDIQSPQASETNLATTWSNMSNKLYEGLTRDEKYPYLAKTDPEKWRQRIVEDDSHPFEGSPSKSRFITITNLTKESLRRAAQTDSPEIIGNRAEKILELFKDVDEIEVQTSIGSSLKFKLETNTKGIREDGQVQYQGQGGNYPFGEVFFSPDWSTVNGQIVIDGPVGGIGKTDSPITITFKDGVIENIAGGEDSQRLKEILSKFNAVYPEKGRVSSPYVLGEFGIGLNGGMQPFQGESLRNDITASEGEKILGTIHVALGKNPSFESKNGNNINYHSDLISMKPNLRIHKGGEWIDVIKNGQHLLF